MTRVEMAKRLRATYRDSAGIGYAEWAGDEDWLACADAAFAALGVTPDPELPPGPWRVDEISTFITTGDGYTRCVTRPMLLAAVAAWNKANGFGEAA